MRLLVPALLVSLAATTMAAAEPLICIDPGPTHIGDIVIDIPEICVL